MEYYTDLRRSRSQSSGFVAQKTVMLGEVKAVMAGLDPAIHLLRKYALRRLMDTRVKPAYDDGEYRSALPAITTDHASFHFRDLRRLLPITCRYACENAGKLAWLHRAGEASAGARGARLSLRNSNFKQQIRLHDLAAQSARALLEFSSTLQSEGAGNAGRRCAAAKSVHVVTTVTPESPGIPRAMVLRFPSCSPLRSGSFATVTCGTYRKLDTSVEMSGPHDFTVRSKIARLAHRYVHRIPPRRP